MVAAWPPCKVQRGKLCRQGAAQGDRDREQGGRQSVSVDGGGLYGKQNVVGVHVVHVIGTQKGQMVSGAICWYFRRQLEQGRGLSTFNPSLSFSLCKMSCVRTQRRPPMADADMTRRNPVEWKEMPSLARKRIRPPDIIATTPTRGMLGFSSLKTKAAISSHATTVDLHIVYLWASACESGRVVGRAREILYFFCTRQEHYVRPRACADMPPPTSLPPFSGSLGKPPGRLAGGHLKL